MVRVEIFDASIATRKAIGFLNVGRKRPMRGERANSGEEQTTQEDTAEEEVVEAVEQAVGQQLW